MILKLHGHIGSTASALIDGQLAPEAEERAWSHVLSCPGCRRLVEREGWVKQRLAGLSDPAGDVVPAGLAGYLQSMDSWAQVDSLERRSLRRRTTGALVGAGSVGVAALAVVALSSAPAGSGEAPTNRGPSMIRPDVIGAGVGGGLPTNTEPTSTRRTAR